MPGSGPGGRWFKSIRPDHYNQQFTNKRMVVERLVSGQEVNGPSAFPPTTLSSLKSMRYGAFSTATSTSFLRTMRTTSEVFVWKFEAQPNFFRLYQAKHQIFF